MNNFNNNLSLLRNRLGMSCTKFADEVGIHKNTYRNLEYGNSEAKVSQLIKICDYLNVTDLRKFITEKIK